MIAANDIRRYFQLGVITLAAGAMYPLIYLRQNFEVAILDSFGITISQLGQCYSMLGVIFVATYLPSGWLADRVPPRGLVAFSLTAMASLGIWFSTMPPFESLLIIFAGWGITTGLTFWAAHLKVVTLLASRAEQGRFLGILDGGRGLVEAILASIAIIWFAHSLNNLGLATDAALINVIYLYVAFGLLLAPLAYFTIDRDLGEAPAAKNGRPAGELRKDLRFILGKEEIWLAAFCILCGYQLFWTTYSYSGYLQNIYGMSGVVVGYITVAKLWTRPLGAVTAGFIGDRFSREKTLAALMLAGTALVSILIAMPTTAGVYSMLALVMLIGLMTYAIRGIFWSTLDSCHIPARIKGLAIGVMSLIGYSPDIYLPLLNGLLLERFPGKLGYSLYFGGIVLMGILGTMAAWRLHVLVRRASSRA